MFVLEMGCRSNNQSPLARGSPTLINIVFPPPSTGTLTVSHHSICCTAYKIMDHALDGTIYLPWSPTAVLRSAVAWAVS